MKIKIILFLGLIFYLGICFRKEDVRRVLAEKTVIEKACNDKGLDPNESLFEDSDESKFLNMKKKLLKEDKGNVFESFFIDSSSSDAITIGIQSFMAPIILMGIIIVLTFPIGYCCYYLCACGPDKCCPPCKCCCPNKCCCIQCDQKEAYAGFSRLWPFLGMFAFCAWILISSIVGLAFTSGVEKSYQKFTCNIINFFEQGNKGDGGNWGGLEKMSTSLTQFKTDYTTVQNSIQTNLQGCDPPGNSASPLCLDDEFTEFSNTITSLDFEVSNTQTIKNIPDASTTFTTDTVFNADFQYIGAQNPDKGSTTAVYSGFFSSTNGLNSQSCYDIMKQELTEIQTQTVSNMKTTIDDLSSSGDVVKDASFMTDLDAGITLIDDQVIQLNDLQSNLYDSLDTMSPYLSLLTLILNCIFGGFLGLSALVIFVGAILFYFNKPKLRIIIHLCWMLFNFIAFVGIIISLVLFTLNAIGFGFCDYVGYTVFKWDDPTFNSANPEWINLNDKIFKLSGTSKDLAETCFKSLGGDGDILETFGIRDILDGVSGITDGLTSSAEFTDTLNELDALIQSKADMLISLFENNKFTYTLINKNNIIEHTALTQAITTINSELSTFMGANPDVWKQNEPTFLANVFPFQQSDPAPQIDYDGATYEDVWVGSWYNDDILENCIYPATNTCPEYLTFNGLNTASNPQYANAGILASYNAVRNYQLIKDAIMLDRLTILIQPATPNDPPVTYIEGYTAIKTKLQSVITSIDQFKTDAETIINSLTDEQDGILGQDKTNCYFVGEAINNALKAVCWGFFASLYQINESLIFISVGLSFASFFMCCTAMRISKNEKLKDVKINSAAPNSSNQAKLKTKK